MQREENLGEEPVPQAQGRGRICERGQSALENKAEKTSWLLRNIVTEIKKNKEGKHKKEEIKIEFGEIENNQR